MGVVTKMLLTAVGLVLLQVISSLCETYEIADDVYSFTTTNAYFSMFVVTGSGVIVIDPSNLEHSKQMLKEINDITSEPVKWVFYSHNHWDHIAGGQVFKDGGATITAHKEVYEWMKSSPGKDVVLPDILWEGYEKYIQMGRKTLYLRHAGSSHGLGMTAFVLPAERVAYIADIVTPNRVGFAFLPDFDIDGWQYTLQRYLELDFDKAVYAHNANPEPNKGGDKEDIAETVQYLQLVFLSILPPRAWSAVPSGTSSDAASGCDLELAGVEHVAQPRKVVKVGHCKEEPKEELEGFVAGAEPPSSPLSEDNTSQTKFNH